MIRIVIADDNSALIRALVHSVPWAENGVEVAGAAADGVEALPLLDAHIDVLVTDVKMPRMDGIELTSLAMARCPHLRVVFLSAHREFEFARNAIQMGVSDYVSKPVDHGALVTAVLKAAAEKRQAEDEQERLASYLPYVRERILTRLLTGSLLSPQTAAEFSHLFPDWTDTMHFLCVLFVVKAVSPIFDIEANQYARAAYVKDLADSAFVDFLMQSVTLVDRNVVCILAFSDELNEGQMESVIHSGKQVIRKASGSGIRLLSGVSAVSCGLKSIGVAYQQAQRALDAPTTLSPDWLRVYAKHAVDVKPQADALRRTLAATKELPREHEKDAYMDGLEALIAQLDQLEPRQVYTAVALHAAAECMQSSLSDAEAPEALLEDYLTLSARVLSEPRQIASEAFRQFALQLFDSRWMAVETTQSSIVTSIYAAIDALSFDGDAGLTQIAQRVHMSPSYVSLIFKQQTGRNIIDVMQEKRLEKAKHLLTQTEQSIGDIGEMVGYQNPFYFSTWFRKQTGTAPSEYRKSHTRTEN